MNANVPAILGPIPVVAEWATGDETPEFQRFLLVCEAEKVVQQAEDELNEAKAVVKVRKEVFDAAVAKLRRLCKPIEEEAPLFHPAKASEVVDGGVVSEGLTWREVSLREALGDLSESIMQHLDEANLTTLGQLVDWLGAKGKHRSLTDIPGIGEKGAEKIQAALDAFWARRQGR